MIDLYCHGCNRLIARDADIGAELVQGWAKRREQGGTNALIKRMTLGPVLCRPCTKNEQLGQRDDQTQGGLWE